MPDFAVTTAFRATDKMSPVFNRMGASSERFGKRASGALGRVNMAAASVGNALRSAIPFFGVAAVGMLAGKGIELASSLTEVQNVVDTTFKNGANQINNFAKIAMEKFGLSELQAKEFTGTLGSMAKSSGISGQMLINLSTNLAGLAGDYASFRNLKPEEAFEKMKSVITGETEPLRQLGLNMTVANLQAFAFTQGITKAWKNMSQAEQVMLRYNYVLKNSKDAQGDFAKTLNESYANQKRVLSVRFDEFLARIMTGILPALTDLFKKFNTVLAGINTKRLSKVLETIVEILPYLAGGFVAYKIALMGAAIWQGIMIASGWIKYLWMMRSFITRAAVAQWLLNIAMSANPVFLVIAGFALLIIYIGIAIKNWNKFGAAMSVVLGPVGMLISYFKTLYDQWEAIKTSFSTGGIIEGLKAIGMALIDAMIAPFRQLWNMIKSATGLGAKSEAPNKSEVEARGQQTVVNLYNRNVQSDVSVTPRQGAIINADMGAN